MEKLINTKSKEYDLEERIFRFVERLLVFIKKIKKDNINQDIINQLTRAATSVGANYFEANASSSRKDFRNKIYISKKEINETKYWLRVLSVYNDILKEETMVFWKEAHESHLIFQKITSTLDKNKN